ncbi:T9SS type A sorting domain-containing protein [Pseudoflavitalea sp. G-6-1-2]|uniref:T9SS type A sorting domain-containing protein n=1 Tax=Pseudoflavitalea sp. G-6-1-2 TaxID=2728841 RepID=UPI00146C3B13|nr:T9SS type A sorting domain-containing protein [Pseudoflavitalea sp. G-6-1-2]NML20149.1 T9SS type A sorting domain-containing protein [Pseudoflavitalea sp. G-6-1-2]
MTTLFVRSSKCYCLVLSAILFLVSSSSKLLAQDGCPDRTFPVMKQKKVTVTIPGTDAIKGYLEALPTTYASQPSKRFPLMIFFHGINEGGDGSKEKLCLLVNQWWWAPPSLVELGKFPQATPDVKGQPTQFILISAQLAYFGDPSAAINPLINYLQTKYRIDPSRIYLTGLSAGANYIMTYAGANATNAKRIAAIAPVSPCMYLNDQQAKVIAASNLGFFTVQCGTDGACDGSTASKNEKLINAQRPTNKAVSITLPVPGWNCNSFTHDSWGTAYDTTFKTNVNGRSVNMYEYLLTNNRSGALPVVLKNFTANLNNGKVQLRWTTATELNNQQFIIERAGADQRFSKLAIIAANGNSSTEKLYEYTDENPLDNISYYRLVQVDFDGNQQQFEAKRIVNAKAGQSQVTVSSNPFTTELSVYVTVPETQQVTLSIVDMSGKQWARITDRVGAGTSEVSLPVSGLSRGVYLLKVSGSSISRTLKIVRN